MDLGIKNQVAMIGGASQGIGKAIAIALAKEGAKVSICARNENILKETAKAIQKVSGVEVLAVVADLTKISDIKKFAKETLSKFGTIDILVNNAGGPPVKYAEELTEEEWINGFRLNLLSTISLSKEVIPTMKSKRWGRIINLTSITAKQPLDKFTISNTTRAGVIGFAKSLSNEVAPYNILVNNVCPGFTRTKRLEETHGKNWEEFASSIEKNIPLGRLASPEEIGNLVAFLASDKASYITGTTIQIDGGFVKGII
jgi:3-oxoacyl-[acyl-carrier protein] reductase